MNVFGIGGLEFLVIALVAFLVLGPRKMADAGKTVARFMSELRKQRDELIAAILEEPPPDPKVERQPSSSPGPGEASDPTRGQAPEASSRTDDRQDV